MPLKLSRYEILEQAEMKRAYQLDRAKEWSERITDNRVEGPADDLHPSPSLGYNKVRPPEAEFQGPPGDDWPNIETTFKMKNNFKLYGIRIFGATKTKPRAWGCL